jgi:hypothetical protein
MAQGTLSFGGECITGIENRTFLIKFISSLYYQDDSVRTLKMVCGFQIIVCFYSIESIVLAAIAIANIVRTSLVPLGLNKMLVDDIINCCKNTS